MSDTSSSNTISDRDRQAKVHESGCQMSNRGPCVCCEISFKEGWDARDEEVKRLKECLGLALYYVEGDATWEGLVMKIETKLGYKLDGIRWTQEEIDAAKVKAKELSAALSLKAHKGVE